MYEEMKYSDQPMENRFMSKMKKLTACGTRRHWRQLHEWSNHSQNIFCSNGRQKMISDGDEIG
jgi:hypothetical protein